MISEKIKNADEKAILKEKERNDRTGSFFEKKSHRLIVSGVIAAALLYPIYRLAPYHLDDILLAALELVQVMAMGALLANINTFSLKKYACAVSVWSVVLYLAAMTWGVLVGMDPAQPMQVVPGWSAHALLGIPVCATITALSVLTAYFAVCGKKKD